jgi:formate dehydrogenase major subunit
MLFRKGESNVVKVTRRDFLKISGATAATFAIVDLGFDVSKAAASVGECRIKNIKGIPTICPYCGCGCGLVAYSVLDSSTKKFVQLLSIEGDPDHPINQGAACPKGSAIFQLRQTGPDYVKDINPKRILKPRYRAAGSDKWEEKDWDWVLDKIVERVKETRDKNFTPTQEIEIPVLDAATGKPVLDADGKATVEKKTIIVNRTEAIASLGGAALDNEEAYLQSKFMRSLGVAFLEHQARI